MFMSLISRGNMFQKVGPETRKLRGPKVIVFVRGTTKSPRAADLRFARPDVSDTLENSKDYTYRGRVGSRLAGRVGSDFLSAIAGRVGSTFRRVGSGPRKVTRGQLWIISL